MIIDRRGALGAAAALLCAGPAWAQGDNWPTRTIRLIVPYLAGTAPDTSARTLADAMGPILRQTIVVENKPGAAGNLGAQIAARSAPDGHTWVYAASPMAAAMRMHRRPGFDVLKDFTMVGRVSISDLLVIAPADSGLRSIADLAERARKTPQGLMYASGGIGSPAHMGAELMLQTAGIAATHVPFKGASESVNAVIGKQVDFALAITSVALTQIRAGKVVPLAITAPQRNPVLPQVPTLVEQGLAGAVVVSFGGLAVPAGTPPAIVTRINEALRQALARPEVRTALESQGSTPAASTAAEYAEIMRAEITQTERMMKAARLDPN
ncbi:MAG: tripartite tricarboxylate transporter substrate binding protein [Rubrivivax sp.]|jgi:tripartite-type tricarboxylate transporter receptor subunit TctC|nr:tripartite tricarboxylate transporter substrate binding protein [Rubrivivax sp.]